MVVESKGRGNQDESCWSMRVSRRAGQSVGAVLLTDLRNPDHAVFAKIEASSGAIQMWRSPHEWEPLPDGDSFGKVAKSLRPLQKKVSRAKDPRYYDLVDINLPMVGTPDPLKVAEHFLATVARACHSERPSTAINDLPIQLREPGETVLRHLLHSLDVAEMTNCPSLHVSRDPVFAGSADATMKLARVLMSNFPWAQRPGSMETVVIGNPHRGNYLKVVPDGEYGMPTLRDLKLLLYGTAQLAHQKNQELDHSPLLKYRVPDFLRYARIVTPDGQTCGANLADHVRMQAVLHGARIETGIETADLRPIRQFHLLEDAGVDDSNAGSTTTGYLRFSDWLYRALLTDDILTVSDEYLVSSDTRS